MDASPLIKAHDHARAASDATRSSDSTVAVNEHALAAGEFSKAAESTGSVEAIRTLRLLEQQHKKLAELLQLPHEQTSQQSTDSDVADGEEKQVGSGDNSPVKDRRDGASAGPQSPTAQSKPRLTPQQQRRYGTRDLTSSIASNLATARGIRTGTGRRGQALTPSVSNEQAHGMSTKGSSRAEAEGKPSWVPPAAVVRVRSEHEQQDKPSSSKLEERPTSPTSSDDGFSRFYNTFGSILNRLSAPLAFAGLPLISEESSITSDSNPPSPEQTNPRRSGQLPQTVSTSTTEPDLSKIYSKATLRALGNHSRPNDSFYVVPTSGHTASYASILGYDAKEQRRRGMVDDNDLDLVETPALHKRLGGDRSDKKAHVVIEELSMENAHLKEMLDKVSKRLHTFEIGSQNSHLALAQSLRMGRAGSPIGGIGAGKGEADEALKKRNRELEEELGQAVARIDQMERENLKMSMTIDKYRERWEKLKAGAKARRDRPDTEGETSKG